MCHDPLPAPPAPPPTAATATEPAAAAPRRLHGQKSWILRAHKSGLEMTSVRPPVTANPPVSMSIFILPGTNLAARRPPPGLISHSDAVPLVPALGVVVQQQRHTHLSQRILQVREACHDAAQLPVDDC